jgi:hypothetical protein
VLHRALCRSRPLAPDDLRNQSQLELTLMLDDAKGEFKESFERAAG